MKSEILNNSKCSLKAFRHALKFVLATYLYELKSVYFIPAELL